MSSSLGEKLINTVEGGDLEGVRDLVLNQNAPVNYANDGWSPLIKAASRGYLEIVRFLIEHEADPNIRSGDQWTPLWAAISSDNDNLEIVQYLLENGANPLLTTKGKTPEAYAKEKNQRLVVMALNESLRWQKLGTHRIQNHSIEPLFEVTRIFNFKSMNVMTVIQDRDHQTMSHSEMHFSNPAVDLEMLQEAKRELLERGGALDERAVNDALVNPRHGRRLHSVSRREAKHGR
ncbi:MAG: hypothetical protein EP349_01495 [Alphaproteobacteria bacterium]|nr:MAG: hypothetical protein EP349_01495 [Alphaproteobacteria bacterium]